MYKTALTFTLLAFIAPAFAKEPVIACAGEWAPFITETKSGGGPATRFFMKKMKEWGTPVDEVKFMTWNDAYQKTLTGECDYTYGWAKTPNRLKEMDYLPVPVVTTSEILVYNKARFPEGQKVVDIDTSLFQKDMAATASYWYIDALKDVSATLHFNDTDEETARLVSDGHADATILIEFMYNLFTRNGVIDEDKVSRSKIPIRTQNYYIIKAKKARH